MRADKLASSPCGDRAAATSDASTSRIPRITYAPLPLHVTSASRSCRLGRTLGSIAGPQMVHGDGRSWYAGLPLPERRLPARRPRARRAARRLTWCPAASPNHIPQLARRVTYPPCSTPTTQSRLLIRCTRRSCRRSACSGGVPMRCCSRCYPIPGAAGSCSPTD